MVGQQECVGQFMRKYQKMLKKIHQKCMENAYENILSQMSQTKYQKLNKSKKLELKHVNH
jgi:uncharacterized membrane protein